MVIRLFCANGMSTSLLVNKMRESAKQEGMEADIQAFPIAELNSRLSGVDCALLGPQVAYKKAEAAKICSEAGVPVDVIPMMDYGTCNGKNVLQFAKNLAGK